MLVKIKKLREDAIIPKYQNDGDAGLDLVAISKEFDQMNGRWKYGTGLAIEIPKGYVGLIFPRSSIYKKGLSLSNSTGIIDSGYRGEICFYFNIYRNDNFSRGLIPYEIGDRIGQLIILPYPEIILREELELSETKRGTDGFGSTGN